MRRAAADMVPAGLRRGQLAAARRLEHRQPGCVQRLESGGPGSIQSSHAEPRVAQIMEQRELERIVRVNMGHALRRRQRHEG